MFAVSVPTKSLGEPGSGNGQLIFGKAFDLLAEDRPDEAAAILAATITSIEDPDLLAAANALLNLAEARQAHLTRSPPLLLLGSPEAEGRFSTVAWTTVGSVAAGIKLGEMLELEDARSNVLVAMTLTGTGLAGSILATRNTTIMPTTASLYGTGLVAGGLTSWQAANIAELSPSTASGLTIAGSVAGGMLGYWAGNRSQLSLGSASLVRSSLMWGTLIGVLMIPTLEPASTRLKSSVMLAGSAGGLSIGAISAGMTDISRARVQLMNLGALVGGLAFGGLGIAILDEKPAALAPLFVPPMAIVGVLAGGALSLLLTNELHLAPDNVPTEAPTSTALLERRDGRWVGGAPVPFIMASPGQQENQAIGISLAAGDL